MPRIEEGRYGLVPIIEANRFSVFTRHQKDLADWFDSFERAGIPAVVVLTDLGYALYRTGMEPDPFEVI